MDLIQGTADNIRFAAEVRGRGAKPHAAFDLDGRPVRMEMGHPPVIVDGDDVAVWARHQDGHFRAAAYRNVTRDVTEYPPDLRARSAIGLVATGTGAYLLEGLGTGRIGDSLPVATFGLALACAGLALLAGLLLLLSGARWSARLRTLRGLRPRG